MDPALIQALADDLEEEAEDQRATEIGMMGGRELQPLTEDEVAAIISEEIASSTGQLGSKVAEDRRRALDYYRSELFGNEVEGRSKVVLSDVQDTVEWAMPGLMRMFTGGPHVARFSALAQGPEAEQRGLDATDYVNHCFMKKNRGFRVLMDAFRSSLISKNVVLKCWVEEYTEPTFETYIGVTDMELASIVEMPNLEIIAAETRQIEAIDEQTGQPIPTQVHDLEVKIVQSGKRLRVAAIPPEEFRIARRATCLDDETPFADHCRKVKVSDLLSWGYDRATVMNLPAHDSSEWNEERIERRSDEELWPSSDERADPASREIWIHDLWIRIDQDGDGYSELRHIVCAGDTSVVILENKTCKHVQMVDLVPIPMPHQFIGRSLADLVMDLQLIRSTIVRQMLDNLYQVNNTQKEVVEAMVEIDDLLNTKPGGIIRTKAPGMIKVLEQTPFPPMVMDFLGFFEMQRENRTGMTKATQGLDASSLQNTTATGVSQMMSVAAAKLELIARVYADALQRFFAILLDVAVEAGLAPEPMMVRGEYREVDPLELRGSYDVEVQVGLGVGRETERLMMLQTVMQVQEKLASMGYGGYLVTPENFYAAARELTNAMGYHKPNLFFDDPRGKEPPPPPGPDEDQKIEAARVQVEAEKTKTAQRQVDIDALKEQALAESRLIELRERMAFDREKLDKELQLKRDEYEARNRTAVAVAEISARARNRADAEGESSDAQE